MAHGLAAAHPDRDVWYTNLAVRGRKIDRIVGEQLDQALALDPLPTMLTFNGGANDMLRPGFGLERVTALTAQVVDRATAAGIEVVLLTGGDPSANLPTGRRFAALAEQLTTAVLEMIDGREKVRFIDNFHDEEGRRAVYWADDRLHPGPIGHERLASRVLTALGVPTEPPDTSGVEDRTSGMLAEMAYWRAFVLPWLGRRLMGRSSGDGRSAKYPNWVRVSTERPWEPIRPR